MRTLPSDSGTLLRRMGVAGALLLGCLGPSVETGSTTERLVVVSDVSASRRDVAYRAPDEEVAETVAVADGAVLASRSGSTSKSLRSRDRSRLGDGLRAAGEVLGRVPGVVRLATDGRDTEGDVVAAAASLAAAGHRVFVEPTEPAPADVAIVAVRVLSAVPGGAVEVRARVESSVEGRVRVALRREGADRAAKDVEVSASRPVEVELVDPATRRTGDAYEVELVPADGTPDDEPSNDRVRFDVPGSLSRVVVVGDGSAPSTLDGDVRTERVGSLAAVDLDATDLLVLSNVPERALRGGGVESIVRFVASGGVLLVTGGEDAYGPGGVGGTGYEMLLPLRTRRDDADRVAAIVALDRSGSTGEVGAVGASPPIADLRAAVRALASTLPVRTGLRVIPFSDEADAPLPAAGPLSTEDREGVAALLATLESISPAGGTNLGKAVEASLRAASAVEGVRRRRVFLLTDGDPDHPAAAATFAPWRAAFDAAGVEFSAVVRGDEAAATALRAIAVRPEDVVRIASSEEFPEALLRAFDRGRAPAELVAGVFAPVAADTGPEATAAAAPRPTRLHRLEPSPDAVVLARATAPEGTPLPVAAVRRVGAGRVVAYAGGIALETGASKAAFRRALRALLATCARSADRGLAATRERDRIVVAGPAGRGSLVLLGPDETRSTLIETRRGLFEGSVPPGTPGDAILRVQIDGGATRALRLPHGPALEVRGAGLDVETLREIAQAGGGRVLSHAEPTPRRRSATHLELSPYCFAVAALLLLLDRLRARRRIGPVGGAS